MSASSRPGKSTRPPINQLGASESARRLVQPVFDAGLTQLVETDHRLSPEAWQEPTPGHTPGHVSVIIESGGERGMISGDFLHHPCQIAHPEWRSGSDTDPDQAEATRHSMLGA